MSYHDTILKNLRATADDEFEVSVLQESTAINSTYAMWMCFSVGAVLAWVLPGPLSAWSLLLILPPIVGSLMGYIWVRRTNPRPRMQSLNTTEVVVAITIAALWLGGIIYNTPGISTGRIIAAVALAAVTVGIGLLLKLRTQQRGRESDQRRIDEQPDD